MVFSICRGTTRTLILLNPSGPDGTFVGKCSPRLERMKCCTRQRFGICNSEFEFIEFNSQEQILQMNDVHFLGESDVDYTLNVTEVLASWWDVPLVQYQLQLILTRGKIQETVFSSPQNSLYPLPGSWLIWFTLSRMDSKRSMGSRYSRERGRIIFSLPNSSEESRDRISDLARDTNRRKGKGTKYYLILRKKQMRHPWRVCPRQPPHPRHILFSGLR